MPKIVCLTSDSSYEIIAYFDDHMEVKISSFWPSSMSPDNEIRLIMFWRYGLKMIQYHGKLSDDRSFATQYQIVYRAKTVTQPEAAEYLRAIGLYLHEDQSRGTDQMRVLMRLVLPLIDDLTKNQVMSNGAY